MTGYPCAHILLGAALLFGCRVVAAEPGVPSPDRTCFQVAAPYSPEVDVGSDIAIVYGVNASFNERVSQWRGQGYGVSMMTGISWGGYDAYYNVDGVFKNTVSSISVFG